MDVTSPPPKVQDRILSALNVAIEALNLAKEVSSPTPAKAVFGSVSVLLTMIRDSKANKTDYVELGLACADVCTALNRGLNGRKADQLGRSVSEAIEQLTMAVAAIQKNVKQLNERNVISRHFHAKDDKDAIAAWKSDLNRILQIFTTEFAVNTHVVAVDIHQGVENTKNMVSDIHRAIVDRQEGASERNQLIRRSASGELPPPRPRACFGRDNLIVKIVGLAESLTPIALVGAGGIGKTSIALVVLHHDQIKKRFGDNRRFIHCDQFPASCAHFLARLSKVIGAGIENPEDLTSLRPSLSSKEMMIILDNAESILDPQGAEGREIYRVVEELSQFSNICLVITSRITTIPPDCETLKIPTLSTGAACDVFYNIRRHSDRSDSVDTILGQLDFHPLSITLLATVAHQNDWDDERLTEEWEKHHTGVLQTEHRTSLAATIELSITSPMFKALGPDARGLLDVIAFYSQGIDKNNLDWLFPTIPNITHILDKFCILSLTYRNKGFVTMLAPLRDHLRPKDPMSSPLLRLTKERYFTRMSTELDPDDPGFEDTQWLASEDVNVEYLVDFFTSVNPDSDDAWDTCIKFLGLLESHKPRPTILGTKIEALPDNHPFKPDCLVELALLWGSTGNQTERMRLLDLALEIFRERGHDDRVAFVLVRLSLSNLAVSCYEEGVHQVREALEIYERLEETVNRAWCLDILAHLLRGDGQLDAAEEAMVQAIKLFPEEGQEDLVCSSHHSLGAIYHSKGQKEKATYHFEVALRLASSLNSHHLLFSLHVHLASAALDESRFDDAYSHIQQAKIHAPDNPFDLGLVASMRAVIAYQQHKLEEARSDVLYAIEIFEKVGASMLETCRALLQKIEVSGECDAQPDSVGDPDHASE